MKNSSVSLSVLVSLFVCRATLNAQAHEVVKTDGYACAMVEPLNEVESPYGSELPSFPTVPILEDRVGEAGCLQKEACTIQTTIKCDGEVIPVESTADDCASAGGAVDDLKDMMGCD